MKYETGNTSSEKKGKRKAIIGIIAFFCILLIGCAGLLWWSFSATPTSSSEIISIDLSSSCGDEISEGGAGEIYALLHFKDGHTENGEFIFKSGDEEALFFATQNSGIFNANKQSEEVIVTVTCPSRTDKKAEWSILIKEANKFHVTFKYPNVENCSDELSVDKTVVEGSMLLDAPTPNYGCHNYKWVIEGKKSSEFNPNKGYFWNEDLVVEAVFDEVEVSFKDELFNETFISQTVKYAKEVNNIAEWRIPAQTERDGWHFEGWYPDINKNELENGIKDGKFCSIQNILYAKWTSEINFVIDSHLGSIDKVSEKVTYKGKIDCPTVTYTKQTQTKGENDIMFDGWYTEQYGTGEKLDPNEYSFTETGLTFYDRTLIKVHFNDELNHSDNEPITIIYGKTMEETQKLSVAVGHIPSLSDSAWVHVGWSYEGKNSAKLDIVDNSDSTYAEQLKSIRYIYSSENPQFNGSITLNSVWELEVKYVADRGKLTKNDKTDVVRYGSNIQLPEMSSGSWNVRGWFIDNDTYENRIAENDSNNISSNGSYFKELAQTYSNNNILTFYAKWEKTVTLDFGNSNGTTQVVVIYGRKMGNDLPTDHNDIGERKLGYTYADGVEWKTEEGEVIDKETYDYPLIMNRLIYQWKGDSYKITFKSYSAGNGHVEVGEETISMDERATLDESFMPNKPLPNGWGIFIGYYYFENADESTPIGNSNLGGVQYFNNALIATREWDKPQQNIVLYAVYGKAYSVTLDANGGIGEQKVVDGLVCGSALPTNITPHTRTGWTFTGYFTEKDLSKQTEANRYYYADMSGKLDWNIENNTTVLYAGWKINYYTLAISANGHSSITVKAGNVEKQNGDKIAYGTELSVSISEGNKDQTRYIEYNGNQYNKSTSFTFTMPEYDVKVYANSGNDNCIAPGTLITLADGQQIPVEKLTGSEMLLVWNLYTGEFDTAPILFIDYDAAAKFDEIVLYFSDGTILEFVGGHGIWDVQLNEYVYIVGDNAQSFIGHSFYKHHLDEHGNQINTKVTLVDVAVEEKIIEAWCPITAGHFSYYTNGILTIPVNDVFYGFINIFDVNPETMKVDEDAMATDIERYGLFAYEDFAEYIPEEVFYAFNGQYLKVAMGKGLLTWDDIFALIERYQGFWQPPTEGQVTA